MKNDKAIFNKANLMIDMLAENYNVTLQQMLHLLILKMNSFNDFDGEQIFNDLLENRNIWEGVGMLPFVSLFQGDIVEEQKGKLLTTYPDEFARPIVYMPFKDFVTYDHLYISIKPENEKKFKKLISKWKYDEISEIKLTRNRNYKFFQLWWD